MKGHRTFLEHLFLLVTFFCMLLHEKEKQEKIQAEKEPIYFPFARK